MCQLTGYYAYCKVCGDELEGKSTKSKIRCEKAKNEKVEDCGDVADNTKDWPGICEPCQIKAKNALKQGAAVDKKWARGSAGGW